jgi:hypothetical protein
VFQLAIVELLLFEKSVGFGELLVEEGQLSFEGLDLLGQLQLCCLALTVVIMRRVGSLLLELRLLEYGDLL